VRKVRTPQGTVLANGQAAKADGKCNRKRTAAASAAARVKRCGKSAPATQRCVGLANPTGSNAVQRG
jgi:hypothetical protein